MSPAKGQGLEEETADNRENRTRGFQEQGLLDEREMDGMQRQLWVQGLEAVVVGGGPDAKPAWLHIAQGGHQDLPPLGKALMA